VKEYAWKESFESLGDALNRLEEALKMTPDEHQIVIDATIQRFEFTFELFWKTLKRFILLEGIETKTPRETLETAYRLKWIQDEKLWIQMLKDRNETSHIYDKDMATEIYKRIKNYSSVLNETYSLMEAKLKKKKN
jgi:nucleotidyltransferase substrate binding protein (TIGR01987 family)